MVKTIHPTARLQGQVAIPGDKSISHRSLLFGALAEGESSISGLLHSDDVLSTKTCLESLGVKILKTGENYTVHGVGLRGFQPSPSSLDCGNSGTTIRLLMGLLAGQNFTTHLTGDPSLSRRPMKRVTEPLSQMGAQFELTKGDFAPLTIKGPLKLKAMHYKLPVASAQVKSAILLAALNAEGTTQLTGLIQSRDHTEIMLKYMGVQLDCTDEQISITGGQKLKAQPLVVPGDPSTAAFWVVAASLVKQGHIILPNILLNPTRTGLLKVIERMGGKLKVNITSRQPEDVGEIQISPAALTATTVTPDEVPSLIDEIPLIALLGTQAQGVTRVHGAEELRVKESDRIHSIVKNFRALGIEITEHDDGFEVEGPQQIQGGDVQSFDDHRIAMVFSLAGLLATGPVRVHGAEACSVSYPNFYNDLEALVQ